MLDIRSDQMEKFSETILESSEDRMLLSLATRFPDRSRKLGEGKARLLVQYGVARAGAYGIVRECDVCQDSALMFTFGCDFDVDPGLAALRAILDDPRLTDLDIVFRCWYPKFRPQPPRQESRCVIS